MKLLPIVAILLAGFIPSHGDEPKHPDIGNVVVIPEHPSCMLEVVRISAPIDSELLSDEPMFHREVELLLKNNSRQPIKVSGYGSDENPLIIDRFQVCDTAGKKWPPLKVRGICGTGLRAFTILPKAQLRFTVTMSVKPEGKRFRFGVVVTDKLHPQGAITFSAATELPKGEQVGADQPATAPESKPEGKEKTKLESEGRSQ